MEANHQSDNQDIAIEALNLLLTGQRHLLVSDYSSAVNSLQEACELFDKKYGIGAQECGEAYLYYGTALLELARLEDGVIDGLVHTKIADISETETEEEDEHNDDDDDSNAGDDDGNGGDGEEGEDDQLESEGVDGNDNDDDKAHNEDEMIDKNLDNERKVDTEEDIGNSDEDKKQLTDSEFSCVASTSKSNIDNENDDMTEDNEASNIEIAWEVLSLAKMVFSRAIDQKDTKLKLAETLQKLGEISIEWENNENAIDLLNECLKLRKEILPEDDRLIAETYYHLGIAFSFSNQCENANNCFRSAIDVIENRISNQKQRISSIIENSDNSDVIESIQSEISQLENLLPEMRLKIEDSRDQMDNAREAQLQEAHDHQTEQQLKIKTKEVQDIPVKDISHLIKRKRNPSDNDVLPKKVLCTNGVNVINTEKPSDNTQ